MSKSAPGKSTRLMKTDDGQSYVGRVASLGTAEAGYPLVTECGVVYDDTAFQIITPVGQFTCGSLLAVHNPVNGQTAYARIIGRQAQFSTSNARVADVSPAVLKALGIATTKASPVENDQPVTLVLGAVPAPDTNLSVVVPEPANDVLSRKGALAVSECGTAGKCTTRERLLILQTTEVRPLFRRAYPGSTDSMAAIVAEGQYTGMDNKSYRAKKERQLESKDFLHIKQEALNYLQDNLSGTYQGDRYRHWNITSFQMLKSRCPSPGSETRVRLPFETQHTFCVLNKSGDVLIASR